MVIFLLCTVYDAIYVRTSWIRGSGVSSLVSPYGEPPVESPPPVVPVVAITGHPYRWTNSLCVASSNAITETANVSSLRLSAIKSILLHAGRSAVNSSVSAEATQVSLDNSGRRSASIDSPISDAANG